MNADCNVHLSELYGMMESIFHVSRELVELADNGDIDRVENRMEDHERMLTTVREKMAALKNSYCRGEQALIREPKYALLLDSIRENMDEFMKKMEVRKDEAFENIQKYQKQKSMVEYIKR